MEHTRSSFFFLTTSAQVSRNVKKLVVLAQFREVSRTTHHGHLTMASFLSMEIMWKKQLVVNIYHVELSHVNFPHGNLSYGRLVRLSCPMASWLWCNDCSEMAAPGRLQQDGHDALAAASCPTPQF